MLSPEFLSPGSQAPPKIDEDEEIVLPSPAVTAPPSPTVMAPPVTSLPPIEPDDESDDESNSDDDYADDADKGYIKISFPVKKGGSAAAQNEDAAEPVARAYGLPFLPLVAIFCMPREAVAGFPRPSSCARYLEQTPP